MEPSGGMRTLSLPEGSRSCASHSRSRANARVRRTTATSGRKCCEQFGRFVPAGSWARTFSELLIGRKEWSSSKCALTWKLRGTRFNRLYFQLAVSALPTEGIDAGSSGTLLKTPSAFDATVTSPKKNPVPGDSGSLAQEIMCGYAARRGLLPTVQTQGLKQCENGIMAFRTGTTSQLNPLFVAEMMGFPVDWTVLPLQIGETNPSKDSGTR